MYKAAGAITDEGLLTFRVFGSRLQGHPTPAIPWVDVATGSLGQGLPYGVGIALAGKKLDRLPYRVWVLHGDSEVAEGSVWEAFEHAAFYGLDNLVAIFDVNKLGWMNKEYLKDVPLHVAGDRVAKLLPKRMPTATRTDPKHVERVTGLLIDRVRTLVDVIDAGAYFFTDGPVEPTPEALEKHCKAPETIERLRAVRRALADAPGFDEGDIETAIRGLAERNGIKAASYIHPLRVALTGQPVSPGIFEVTSIVGRETSLARIDALLDRLSSSKQAATSGTSA
jgi:glutamyl/glutaminyl-tRNA synthetase